MATGKTVTVEQTAKLIHQASPNAAAELQINKDSSGSVAFGGPDVTHSTGFRFTVAGDSTIRVRLRAGEALYAIAEQAPVDVHVLVSGE